MRDELFDLIPISQNLYGSLGHFVAGGQMRIGFSVTVVSALSICSHAVQAQENGRSTVPLSPAPISTTSVVTTAPDASQSSLSASPFGDTTLNEQEVKLIEMPRLDGPVTPEDVENFDKYFYFRRPNTSLAVAYNDIKECDGYASGLTNGRQYTEAPYPYAGTLTGAAGAIIANVMIDAILGSAERRKMRRTNLRTCMKFKGYERYGLPKALWDKFNFEEGLYKPNDDKRQSMLRQQALVASRAMPSGTVLEP